MRGLTRAEQRILLPDPPGEGASDNVIQQLVKDGRAYWKAEADGETYLTTTYFGRLALAVCLVSDEH